MGLFSSIIILFLSYAKVQAFEQSVLLNQIEKINKINIQDNCSTCKETQVLSHEKASALTDLNSQKIELTVLSLDEANELVANFSKDPNIPFDYALDGCFSRAHKMAYLLDEKGIISGKAFIMGRLFASTKYGPASWRYHVAPVVLVKVNQELKPYIIDPALFSTAVPYEEWKSLITGATAMPGRARGNPARVIEYYTNRFVYDPNHAKEILTEFNPAELADTDASLARFQEIKKQIEARNKNF